MDIRADLFQPLLVADAEMLLFVDNQEAKVLEGNRLAKKGMRANNDIDDALRQVLGDRFLHLPDRRPR